jgi:hypothetical protein
MGCIFSSCFTSKVKVYGECTICLEDMDSTSNIFALNCAHIYHEECVKMWLQKNSVCPICSFKI